ncbi:hypothetical protein FMO003_38350 [Moritella sp. F3]|nr:hypothetical protein FMO001_43460 [Moritella sp. F1]GIC83555.1 hypothetical protein FMO003_38350 [Moritella sp. F3]
MFKFLDLKIGILTLSSSNAVGPPAKEVLVERQNTRNNERHFNRLQYKFIT